MKQKKSFFKSVSSKDMATNQYFQYVVKTFFSIFSFFSINDKTKVVDNKVKLIELFNTYFANTVENATGKAPTSFGDSSDQ